MFNTKITLRYFPETSLNIMSSQGFIRDTLLSLKTLSRPYWVGNALKKIVADHISGRRVFYREIRKVLQIEMIQRVLIEDIERSSDGSCKGSIHLL